MKIKYLFIMCILMVSLVGCVQNYCCENKIKTYVIDDTGGLNYWTSDSTCPFPYKWSEGVNMNLCHYPSEKSAHDFYDNYLKCEETKVGCTNIRKCNLIRFNHQWEDKCCD